MSLYLLSTPKIINMYTRSTLHHAYVLVAILSVSFSQSNLCISARSRSLMKCDAIRTSESMKTVTGQRPADANPRKYTDVHIQWCVTQNVVTVISAMTGLAQEMLLVCAITQTTRTSFSTLSHTRKWMHSPCLSTLFLESYLCEKPDLPSYRSLGCRQSCLPEVSLRT